MILDPQAKLTIGDVESLITEKGSLKLKPSSLKPIENARKLVDELAAGQEAIYGVNTGFGRLAQVRISKEELIDLQINLLRSHAAGIGEPISPLVARRLLLLRVLSLGKGYSGISVEILKRHLDYLNKNLTPMIPEQGSVGASGDLAPLAHLGLTFMGEGAFVEGSSILSAKKVLQKNKLKPITIRAKEGLALVNGTQFSLALALEVRDQLHSLIDWMFFTTALTIEGHRASAEVFRADLHSLKPHPHQREIAKTLSSLLADSPHMKGHADCDIVQDAYSFRAIPQILGPAFALLDQADDFFENEVNSVSDNPVVFSKKRELVSGGHFHAQYVSMGCDLLALSMATMGNLIERRIDQLVSPLTTRTEGFLADRPGVQSGMMIVQTAASAIAHENQTLAHPASASTIPTNGNQEDHVSMAPWAARKALMMVRNLRRLIAAETICAVRASVQENERTGLGFSKSVEGYLKFLAQNCPNLFRSGDRVFGDDWQKLEALMKNSR